MIIIIIIIDRFSVPTVKETISITESLNAINENIRKYRRVFRSDVDVLIKCINEHETLDSDQALSTLKCFGEYNCVSLRFKCNEKLNFQAMF